MWVLDFPRVFLVYFYAQVCRFFALLVPFVEQVWLILRTGVWVFVLANVFFICFYAQVSVK